MAKEEIKEVKTLEQRHKELVEELNKTNQLLLRLEGALMIIDELIEESK